MTDWAAVAELLPRLSDSTTRVVVYNAIRDAVRDSDLAADAALDILLPALAAEPVELVLAEMFGFATTQLAGVYAVPTHRPPQRRRICALASELLEQAEPGSDRQLTAARAMLHSCDDTDLLQSWRVGERVPTGLVLDAELRWTLVTRLAALGALSAADIDTELAADASTAGRGARGTGQGARGRIRQAKSAAWRDLTEPTTLSAYELYAIGEGFFAQGQDELTRPYVDRFFADMPGTGRLRSGWALPLVITAAFPVLAASPAVLELAEATLAGELDPKVRRAMTDGTDVASPGGTRAAAFRLTGRGGSVACAAVAGACRRFGSAYGSGFGSACRGSRLVACERSRLGACGSVSADRPGSLAGPF